MNFTGRAQICRHKLKAIVVKDFCALWTRTILRGFSQIMLQKNPVTGIIFMIAVAVSARWQFFWGALGGLCGTLSALLVAFQKAHVTALTAPFVISCWLVLAADRLRKKPGTP